MKFEIKNRFSGVILFSLDNSGKPTSSFNSSNGKVERK